MIYQLKFSAKKQAIDELKKVGILDEEENYTEITHAVVHVGKIVDIEGTYSDEGELLTEPTFMKGYHVDVMTKVDIDFGDFIVTPNNPRHTFAI